MQTKRPETQSATLIKGDKNRDPMTGEPGAHPVGVGTGATGGGIAGAVIGGAVGGPIGAGIGAVVGVISGGIVGKSAAEALNPTAEHEFWRKEYRNRPYFAQASPYEDFGPAYQYGWESYLVHKGKEFKDVEAQLSRDWESRRGRSKLGWNHASAATKDAWQRVERATCGDSCSSA